MDYVLTFLHFISDLLNNVEFIKGFMLGAVLGFFGMVKWRGKRIKDLESDLEFDRKRFIEEIERLKKENTSLIINQSAQFFKS